MNLSNKLAIGFVIILILIDIVLITHIIKQLIL